MIPILIITKPGSARHLAAAAHLDALGLTHEVSPAVFPEGDPPWSAQYDMPARLRNLGYSMDKGEVGCFLAHRQAWSTLRKKEWPAALIIEDDARLIDGVADMLEAVAGRTIDLGCYVRLFPGNRISANDTWRQLGRGKGAIVYPRKPGVSTVAYVITNAGAASLLEHSATFWCAVDEFMNLEHVHGVAGLHLDPPAATHEDGGASLIGSRAKPSVGMMAKVRREVLRAFRNLRLASAREAMRWKLGIRQARFLKNGRGT